MNLPNENETNTTPAPTLATSSAVPAVEREPSRKGASASITVETRLRASPIRYGGGVASRTMGREARCPVRHDGEQAEARVLLETDELIVRSPFRLKIPRAEITNARPD